MNNYLVNGVTRTQRGFSLIELMVAITISLFLALSIATVWGNFESQKQRTVNTSSAQVSGLLALTELEQDIKSAGAGFPSAVYTGGVLLPTAYTGCTNISSFYNSGTSQISPVPAYAGTTMPLAPVTITSGGAGPDTLIMKRGGVLGAAPTIFLQDPASMPLASDDFNVQSTVGFNSGDVVMAVQTGTGKCMVTQLGTVNTAAGTLGRVPGAAPTYTPSSAYQLSNGWPLFSAADVVFDIGVLTSVTYSVNAMNQLVLTDNTNPAAAVTTILASDIVDMKAQYGVAAAGTQNVTTWVNATSTNANDPTTNWAALTAVTMPRIKAVRLAVVARSSTLEATAVTGVCTNISGGVNNGPCAWPDTAGNPAPIIDLSSNANWANYRYRVYQLVVPLRNVIWAGV
jgi:type IV pilus assembly protein PilW